MLTHMQAALSFLFPRGCYEGAVVSASVIEKELLLFYFTSQCHLSLLIHSLLLQYCLMLWSTSCVTSPVLYMPSVPEGVHLHVLLPVYLVWMYTLVCLMMCWCCLSSFLLFTSLCFSAWLLQDSQSMTYKSRPGLYMMHTLYRCINSIMLCNYCDSMAISLHSIATNDLWLVMMQTSLT